MPNGFEYKFLDHVTWPLGGVGAALLGLTGTGGLDRIANRHRPDIRGASFSFAALSFPDRPNLARVLEGQVPDWKIWTDGLETPGRRGSCAIGDTGAFHHGFARLHEVTFTHRFPFADLTLREQGWPLEIRLTAWSPFIPGDSDASGMPVTALTYHFDNPHAQAVSAIFSYHFQLALLRERTLKGGTEKLRRSGNGVVVDYQATPEMPWAEGGLSIEIDGSTSDCAWFRGGWFDARSMLWKTIAEGSFAAKEPHREGGVGDGASLFLPIEIPPHSSKQVTVRFAWYEPTSDQWHPHPRGGASQEESAAHPKYRPHYAVVFPSVDAVSDEFRRKFDELEHRTAEFSWALHATDIPEVALEAVTANLGILRSPTLLRQDDGRLWNWEGCHEVNGSCHGSCTHVWNYAQAMAYLFPNLERSLRDTEFHDSQDERGHQNFRTVLPIGAGHHEFHAAADGQFGGIIKAWREWQLSGDRQWLLRLWPRIQASLNYCIGAWDPDHLGALSKPHHNTYDIEFWGPDGMCGTFYAAALKAGVEMAYALEANCTLWESLLKKSVAHLENELFRNGRFIQQRQNRISAADYQASQTRHAVDSPEAAALLESEGPKYQYGSGCLSDGVVGAWLADAVGLGSPLDREKVRSHLNQVHRFNLRHDLRTHSNPQRPGYAIGNEGGLLLCTWPDGDRPSLPFVYSDEVWTGIEYQVASHCIMAGLVEEGLEIVRVARARYVGHRRNPFDEYEFGHWYGRALSSWALLYALTGVRYSMVSRQLWIAPRSAKRPYRAFLGVGGNFGTVTLYHDGLEVNLLADRSRSIE